MKAFRTATFSNNNLVISWPLEPIRKGVPQGSVLGPALFLPLTNVLPLRLQNYCQAVMYADDIVVTLENKNKD